MPRQQPPEPPYKITPPGWFWPWLTLAARLRLDVEHAAGQRDGSLDRPAPYWWRPWTPRDRPEHGPLVRWVPLREVPDWSDWYTFSAGRAANRPAVRVRVQAHHCAAWWLARRVGSDEAPRLLGSDEDVADELEKLAQDVPAAVPRDRAPWTRADFQSSRRAARVKAKRAAAELVARLPA